VKAPTVDPREHAIARLENHVQLAKLKPVSEILKPTPLKISEENKDSLQQLNKAFSGALLGKEPSLRERKREKRENVKLAKETKRESKTLTGNPAGYTCTSPNCKNYGKRFEGIPASWTCNGCLRKFSLLKKD